MNSATRSFTHIYFKKCENKYRILQKIAISIKFWVTYSVFIKSPWIFRVNLLEILYTGLHFFRGYVKRKFGEKRGKPKWWDTLYLSRFFSHCVYQNGKIKFPDFSQFSSPFLKRFFALFPQMQWKSLQNSNDATYYVTRFI
jgi:hypothetical protein